MQEDSEAPHAQPEDADAVQGESTPNAPSAISPAFGPGGAYPQTEPTVVTPERIPQTEPIVVTPKRIPQTEPTVVTPQLP